MIWQCQAVNAVVNRIRFLWVANDILNDSHINLHGPSMVRAGAKQGSFESRDAESGPPLAAPSISPPLYLLTHLGTVGLCEDRIASSHRVNRRCAFRGINGCG